MEFKIEELFKILKRKKTKMKSIKECVISASFSNVKIVIIFNFETFFKKC